MPEGDTIFRAARTLHRALAGETVTRFESPLPHLSRVHESAPLTGRVVERVEARGKHLLIWFSGDVVLRTHMRMHGSWHIYRPGETWRRPRADMRILLETGRMHAVAFNVPIARLVSSRELEREAPLQSLGPDPLAASFDRGEAVARLEARPGMDIADALLDQTAIAGIGNVYKSETLFAARINPFAPVARLSRAQLEAIVATAERFMRANVREGSTGAITTYGGLRRTTGRSDPAARLWVYGREGKPCRRCGTPIERRRQGPHARSTYWCPRCQPAIEPE